MRSVTTETQALIDHLVQEFGSFIRCPRCSDIVAPPTGVPFEVLEPLQTEPHPIEEARWVEHGLTSDQCVPVGIYGGVEDPGIFAGTSTHDIFIEGFALDVTNRVCVRLVNGNLDWRAVRALNFQPIPEDVIRRLDGGG